MYKSGVVSVSFRKNSAEEIIEAAKAAKLSVIEWGGDVHSPAGDVARAEELASLSSKAGIELLSYGSYFRLGVNTVEEFSSVLQSALALGTSKIRIWGYKYIPECCGDDWDRAVRDARAMCEMVKPHGILLCLECHNGSITEDYHSAIKFIKEVNHSSMRLYWQINEMRDKEYNLAAIRTLAPYVEVIHTFFFKPGRVQVPLAEGREDWLDYLREFSKAVPKRELPMLLEFMPDGKIESLITEAESLNALISEAE